MAQSHEPTKGETIKHVEDLSEAGNLSGAGGSTTLALVLAEENPKPFWSSFLRLYLCLAVAYMCSSTNGFDANTFGAYFPFLCFFFF